MDPERVRATEARETWFPLIDGIQNPTGSGAWTDLLRRASTDIGHPGRSPANETVGVGPSEATDTKAVIPHRKRLASIIQSGHPKRSLGLSDHDGSASGTSARPIDLTTSPPRPDSENVLTRRHMGNAQAQAGRRASTIGRPTWQPDGEVHACPVCSEPFTWYFRRHHCRRCGRVVCANCSQHRITMPRQCSVWPPNDSQSLPVVTTHSGPSTLEGAQAVRVCNPCVPVPKSSPPLHLFNRRALHSAYQQSQPRPASNVTLQESRLPEYQASIHRQPAGVSLRPDVQSTSSHRAALSSSVSSVPNTTPPPTAASRPSQRRVTLSSTSVSSPRSFATPHAQLRAASSLHHHDALATSLTQIPSYRQRPQLAEEDECPVCGNELPPRNTANEDAARATHIDECIKSYGSYPTQLALPGPRASSSTIPSSSARTMSTFRPIDITFERTTASPSAAPGTNTGQVMPLAPQPSQYLLGSQRRPSRMLEYKASEKDCIGDHSERQECIICFEEFEVGDDLGRLECLCKFHKRCILGWWRAKESSYPGSRSSSGCPTHVLQVLNDQ